MLSRLDGCVYILCCCAQAFLIYCPSAATAELFTAPQTYFHWQQAWTNVAGVSFCHSKEEILRTGNAKCVCSGFTILLVPQCNFGKTQNRKLQLCDNLYDTTLIRNDAFKEPFDIASSF